MGLVETVVRLCCPCCSDSTVTATLRAAFLVSAVWVLVDWITDLQTLVATYRPKCFPDPPIPGEDDESQCGYLYGSIVSLLTPSLLYTVYMLVAWCQGQDLSCRTFLLFGPLYFISAPVTVLSLAVKAVCCYGGDQQREQDQDRARALKIFEHLGEALPQLTISLVFLYSEGVSLHPLTVLSAVVSAISLMIGIVTGAVALYKRGLTV